jgi:glycosyltransferase involved in cell wall biosynthesis
MHFEFYSAIVVLTVCVAGVIHPFTTYPLSLCILARYRQQPEAGKVPRPFDECALSFALVCCAYNERSVIEQKISNTLAAASELGAAEVVFYDDGSTDGTYQVLAAGPSLAVLRGHGRQGKTFGINTMLSQVMSDVIVFSDANVTLDTARIAELRRLFGDPDIGLVSGCIDYVNADSSDSARVSDVYQRFEERLKALETATGSTVYTDGTVFALRRSLFSTVPADVTDDFFIALSVLARGSRVIASPVLRASEKASVTLVHDFRRRIRIGCNSFVCHMKMSQQISRFSSLDHYKYFSHKLVRWFCCYFMVLGISAFLVFAASLNRLAEATILIGMLAALLAAGAAAGVKACRNLIGIFIAIFAVGVGVSMAILGRRYITWAPPASAR